ncbi:MAG: hypothetical protein KDC87_15375 [Planctomycetes bacterium]|nr:hypothetical protein [Planctomycetota bacterium]MCB9870484.1 hypothetical protein [Planctomycetota bacterium]MCB9889159.1 hypothetical protein [Planctomycetota bacterium]
MTSEQYLWDKRGPSDPFVAGLERALADQRSRVEQAGRRRGLRVVRVLVPIAVSAAAALFVWLWLSSPADHGTGRQPAQPVVIDAGTPTRPSAELSPDRTRAEGARADGAGQAEPSIAPPAASVVAPTAAIK